ncbi:putative mitochondrial protein AtMg00310 [Silene latifolia]|uniref:putative mitochondrial protein AtMg00310 n=1 Tax=Silene latifolia TaxID=37657 RepID=UPI003D779B21
MCQPKWRGGLGFMDFRLFNLALLGKQVWRIITILDSLIARLLRAKYFPNGDILSAGLGSNSSYTWRGIFEARSVVERGLRRRIGNGLSTGIWKDAWIPANQTGRVISPCSSGNENMTVADLLDEEGMGWNLTRLDQLFLPFERDRILGI